MEEFISSLKLDFKQTIEKSISESLNEHLAKFFEEKKEEKEFLSRKGTADFYDVSLVTIHSWVNEGLLTPYKMGNRTYFKRSELVEKLLNSNPAA